jgi:hypothetical protein
MVAAKELGLDEKLIVAMMKTADEDSYFPQVDKAVKLKGNRTERDYIEDIKIILLKIQTMSLPEIQRMEAHVNQILKRKTVNN